MNTLTAKHEILTKEPNMNALQFIEMVGRTCYKSEDKITADGESAKKFVKMLINNGHTAMIEHEYIILEMNHNAYEHVRQLMQMITESGGHHYLVVSSFDRILVSGNIRAWRDFLEFGHMYEKGLPFSIFYNLCTSCGEDAGRIFFGDIIDVDFILNEYDVAECSKWHKVRCVVPEELTSSERYIHERVTVKLICDRGITHECVRHRVSSFAQESTRYCNYSGDKFGNEITFIDLEPGIAYDKVTSKLPEDKISAILQEWVDAMDDAEQHYMTMLDLGATPQIARSVLPNSTKAELIMTQTIQDWLHFFELRTASGAHPQMREVAIPLLHTMCKLYPEIADFRKVVVDHGLC